MLRTVKRLRSSKLTYDNISSKTGFESCLCKSSLWFVLLCIFISMLFHLNITVNLG